MYRKECIAYNRRNVAPHVPMWSYYDMCERYSVSLSTISKWARNESFPKPKKRTLKFSKGGAKLLFDISEVDLWHSKHIGVNQNV